LGKLIVVGTPIGNLGDISKRACDTLASADMIACEDTRVTLQLLNHLGLSKHLLSCHDHNEEQRSSEIAGFIREGKTVVLASDSGMPLISDPGYRIVRKILAEGLEVDIVPGPTALVSALIMSGLPVERFAFLGFLPEKKIKIQRLFEEVAQFRGTVILYESPWKLLKILNILKESIDIDRISVVKELTKIHQSVITGTIDEVITKAEKLPLKGEYVILYTKKFKDD
jgi:16S rRNA (cytidine1402-2'-O)-methyltransferase